MNSKHKLSGELR